MVIQWDTHHKDNPHHPEDNENKEKWTDDISEYLNNFLKFDQGTWFDLTLAANYLEIKDLFDVTRKAVVNMIKGKTEEIWKTLNIKSDFTEEGETQVCKVNQPCEEKWNCVPNTHCTVLFIIVILEKQTINAAVNQWY